MLSSQNRKMTKQQTHPERTNTEGVEAYKYLGVMINNKGNLSAHITETEKKIQAATQSIITETDNK